MFCPAVLSDVWTPGLSGVSRRFVETIWIRESESVSGFSVRGILQARILEWIAMPSSRGSSRPRSQTWVSSLGLLHCRQICFFTIRATRKSPWIREIPNILIYFSPPFFFWHLTWIFRVYFPARKHSCFLLNNRIIFFKMKMHNMYLVSTEDFFCLILNCRRGFNG